MNLSVQNDPYHVISGIFSDPLFRSHPTSQRIGDLTKIIKEAKNQNLDHLSVEELASRVTLLENLSKTTLSPDRKKKKNIGKRFSLKSYDCCRKWNVCKRLKALIRSHMLQICTRCGEKEFFVDLICNRARIVDYVLTCNNPHLIQTVINAWESDFPLMRANMQAKLVKMLYYGELNEARALAFIKYGEISLSTRAWNGHTALTKFLSLEMQDAALKFLQIAEQRNDREWLNFQTTRGNTALIYAAYMGYQRVVEILLSYEDINLNLQGEKGDTALTWAIKKGHIAIALNLIQVGADIHIKMNSGDTALTLALPTKSRELISLLVVKGVNLGALASEGHTTLTLAASIGQMSAVQALLAKENGVNINTRGKNGYTALMWAINGGYTDIAHDLITAGADVTVVGSGQTALSLAEKMHQTSIIQRLINLRPDYIDHPQWVLLASPPPPYPCAPPAYN